MGSTNILTYVIESKREVIDLSYEDKIYYFKKIFDVTSKMFLNILDVDNRNELLDSLFFIASLSEFFTKEFALELQEQFVFDYEGIIKNKEIIMLNVDSLINTLLQGVIKYSKLFDNAIIEHLINFLCVCNNDDVFWELTKKFTVDEKFVA